MATKKKKTETVTPAPEYQEEVVVLDIPEEKEKGPELCGHVNKHSNGPDGNHDNPTCDLPRGHTGDHAGVHKENFRIEVQEFVDGVERIIKKLEQRERRIEWGPMAGIALEDIPTPEPVKQPTLMEMDQRVRRLEAERRGT